MLLVEFCFNPLVVDSRLVRSIFAQLPRWVAQVLDVQEPGGQLTPTDVKVRVRLEDHRDTSNYQIEIIVRAKYFKAREKKLDEAAAFISQQLEAKVCAFGDTRIKGFVFILLSPASFAEFGIE